MALLLNCGAIFLHVPKTGGCFISDVLEANNMAFGHIGEIHCHLGHAFAFEKWFRASHRYSRTNNPLFKFCFVRHPLSWIESWYKDMCGRDWRNWGGDPYIYHPCSILDDCKAYDFNVFVENVLRKRPGFVSELYGLYANQGIHFIGRQEKLVEDLMRVLQLLDLKIPEEHIRAFRPVNVSRPTQIQWRPDLKEEMLRAEYPALQRFGYTPDYGFSEAREKLEMVPFEFVKLSGPFLHEGGSAFECPMPRFAEFSDCLADPFRSALVLEEDGRVLSPHALHDEIRQKGGGIYSHWNDTLLFAPADNSDPNTNGKKYRFRFCFSSRRKAGIQAVQ
jgi:hypothetical protein